MSKITAMYIRLSMEDEDVSLNRKEESNSISSQRELLKAYIENHSELKDTKVQEYCDDGFTGTKFERPGYMKLMEDIRAEKISCIVVKDLSRLGTVIALIIVNMQNNQVITATEMGGDEDDDF